MTLTWMNDSRPTALEILNILGQRVRTYEFGGDASAASVEWDGRDAQGGPVSSGVYFARLISMQQIVVTRIVLLK